MVSYPAFCFQPELQHFSWKQQDKLTFLQENSKTLAMRLLRTRGGMALRKFVASSYTWSQFVPREHECSGPIPIIPLGPLVTPKRVIRPLSSAWNADKQTSLNFFWLAYRSSLWADALWPRHTILRKYICTVRSTVSTMHIHPSDWKTPGENEAFWRKRS